MLPNPQFPADLVTFTEEILKGKLDFLCNDTVNITYVCLYAYTSDSYLDPCQTFSVTLHKKWGFPWRISSVNVTKSAGNYGPFNITYVCLYAYISDSYLGPCQILSVTLHKKWTFSVRISPVNVAKSAENCGFGHIYWRNP